MPDPGRASRESFLVKLPDQRVEYPPLPWKCAGATMLNVYFEVRKDVLLDRLPPEFCRTSPAYCRLFVIDHPESPIGPFREATLALGCRLNMMPAAFVAASMTDSPKALAAGIFERGYPNTLGRIDFESGRTSARASIGDANGTLVEVVMPALQTIEPSRLAYDHVDAIKTIESAGTVRGELVVTARELAIERAAICKNARITYPQERPESPWQILQCRNVISAQVVGLTRTFAAGGAPQ